MSPKKVELIIGPCAVESYEQMEKIGKILSFYQIRYLRAGAYKPRTSPKSFQGMGKEGIEIIHEVAQKYNLLSVSEIMDVRDIDFMKDKIDILQVGSRNMYNYTLLKELGKVDNTILLKRGLSATFEEFIEASEYINVNGLPLKRQEADWKQLGVPLSRATLANGIIYCAENYLCHVYDYFHRQLLMRRYLMADETRVQVLNEPERNPETDSWMWLFRSGEDELPPILLYHYTETRAKFHAASFLQGFSGYLEADGYQGYNNLPDILYAI